MNNTIYHLGIIALALLTIAFISTVSFSSFMFVPIENILAGKYLAYCLSTLSLVYAALELYQNK